jgi:hypothetical protein
MHKRPHDEVVEKVAPGGKAPVYAKASVALVGLFVNPSRPND